MEETTYKEAPGVYAVGMTDSLLQSVGEIAHLVGVEVRICDRDVPGDATLVLAQPETARKLQSEAPTITVSESSAHADLRLPSQAPELAQVLLSGGMKVSDQTRLRTVFVSGWQGGAGTSVVAAGLADASGALLLDASGNPPYQEVGDSDLHWGRVDPHDPPLLGDLFGTATRGSRRIGVLSKLPDSVMVEDPRVLNLLGAVQAQTVVDAGVWRPALEGVMLGAAAGGRPVRLVLVGRASTSDCLRLVNVLTAGVGLWQPGILICANKPGEQLRLISDYWDIPLMRKPRKRKSKKVWRQTWEKLWQGAR